MTNGSPPRPTRSAGGRPAPWLAAVVAALALLLAAGAARPPPDPVRADLAPPGPAAAQDGGIGAPDGAAVVPAPRPAASARAARGARVEAPRAPGTTTPDGAPPPRSLAIQADPPVRGGAAPVLGRADRRAYAPGLFIGAARAPTGPPIRLA